VVTTDARPTARRRRDTDARANDPVAMRRAVRDVARRLERALTAARERSVRANVGELDAPARARGLVASPVSGVDGARGDASASGVGGAREFGGVCVAREGAMAIAGAKGVCGAIGGAARNRICRAGRVSAGGARGFASQTEAEESGEDAFSAVGADGASEKTPPPVKFIVPPEVPEHLRAFVRNEPEVAVACAASVTEGIELVTNRVAEGDYPPGSRQLRSIVAKVTSIEEVRAVLDFMAKMHRIRSAKHNTDETQVFWSSKVILDLFYQMHELKDYEGVAWSIENLPTLGIQKENLVAKQAFFATYNGPFEYVYRVYDAVRDKFGATYFATATMIGACLDKGMFDLAREYEETFTASGAIIPSKTYYKFFNYAIKAGNKEHAAWANEQYLKSIERAIERRKQRMERINSEIDAGTYQGKESRYDINSIEFHPKPTMPFYYMTLAKMHLLNGDVEGATRAFNDVPDFQHEYRRRDAVGGFEKYNENVEEACLSNIARWVQELYDDANYTGEPSRDELKTMLKSALDGVERPELKTVYDRFDIDAAFASGESASEESQEGEDASDDS